VSKAAPRIGDRNAPDRNWLDQIPTDDAEAALQFCRALVRQIEGAPQLSNAKVFNPQLTPRHYVT
jgi:hypothetical protein